MDKKFIKYNLNTHSSKKKIIIKRGKQKLVDFFNRRWITVSGLSITVENRLVQKDVSFARKQTIVINEETTYEAKRQRKHMQKINI